MGRKWNLIQGNAQLCTWGGDQSCSCRMKNLIMVFFKKSWNNSWLHIGNESGVCCGWKKANTNLWCNGIVSKSQRVIVLFILLWSVPTLCTVSSPAHLENNLTNGTEKDNGNNQGTRKYGKSCEDKVRLHPYTFLASANLLLNTTTHLPFAVNSS